MKPVLITALVLALGVGSGLAIREVNHEPAQSGNSSTPPEIVRENAAPPQVVPQQGMGAFTLVGYTDNYAPGTMANLPLFRDNNTGESWTGTSLRGSAPTTVGYNGMPEPSQKYGRARFYLSTPLIPPGGVPIGQGSPETWVLVVPGVCQYAAMSSTRWDRVSPLTLFVQFRNPTMTGLVVPATVTIQP